MVDINKSEFGYAQFDESASLQMPAKELFARKNVKMVSTHVKSENFIEKITKQKATIAMIFKQGCIYCEMSKGAFANLGEYFVKIKKDYNVVAIDYEDMSNDEWLESHDIRGVPMFLFYKKGSNVNSYKAYENGNRTTAAFAAAFVNYV